jgi:hypothetical protein
VPSSPARSAADFKSEIENRKSKIRELPRARLPISYIGPGVSQAVLDGHLLNLRKALNPRTGVEDWLQGVENHLGLAKTYARLAQTVLEAAPAPPCPPVLRPEHFRTGPNPSRFRFQPPVLRPAAPVTRTLFARGWRPD